MPRPNRERTTARVLPVNGAGEVLHWGFWHMVQDQTYFATRLDDLTGLHFDGQEPLERGTIDQAAWWTPHALDADGTAANDQLTHHMRAAVRAILGDSPA